MVNTLSRTWKFFHTAVAEVEPKGLPTLALLVWLRSLGFLLVDRPLWFGSAESRSKVRLSHEAVLTCNVLEADFAVQVELAALAVPLVAGAADEGAGKLPAEGLGARGRSLSCVPCLF